MGFHTAQLLIGEGHPNHGGIIPQSWIYLSENSRPVFIIGGNDNKQEVSWIPTLEGALEDALLMVGAYVLKDKVLLKELSAYLNINQQEFVELYEVLSNEQLKDLYKLNQKIMKEYTGLKIVLTVLEGSLLRGQIGVLKNYQVDMEVCIPVYSCFYSEWKGEVVENGNLDIS